MHTVRIKKQTTEFKKKFRKLVFVWNIVPEHLHSKILERMEFYGFPTFREYARHLVISDIKKRSDKNGKISN